MTVVPTADTTPGFAAGGATAGTFAAQTERRVYTYSIATRGRVRANVQQFSTHVAHSLNDPRGWSLGGSIEFRQVRSGGNFTVWLATAGSVPSFSSVCSANWSCRAGRNVIINETRWLYATPSWRAAGGSLDSYQHYVVVHEAGHWLGFGHANCPGRGRPAPTMQQQSKGLQGCRHNGWPVTGERGALSRRTGAPARPVGPSSDRVRWGRPGDVVLACDWNGDGVDTQAIFRRGTWYVRDGLTQGPGPHVHLRPARRHPRVRQLERSGRRRGRRRPRHPVVPAQHRHGRTHPVPVPLRLGREPAGRRRLGRSGR